MYVECKKKKTTAKETTKQNMFMKCVGPQNIEIKQKKKKETDKSVIMFSTVECVPPSWVPEQFFAKK